MKKLSHIKRLAPLLAAAAIIPAAASAAEGDIEIPYGNLGLNNMTDMILDMQSKLQQSTGITFNYDLYAVLLTNPYGGQSQGTNYTQEMIFSLTADMDQIAGWKGGSFVISGAYDSGENLGNKIGNFFTPSESLVVNGAIFYQMYIRQELETAIGKFDVKLGRISMGSNFAGLPAFGNLVSGGMDSTPEAIFSNSPFSSSPTATWGVVGSYTPVEEITLSAGLYQIPQNIASSNWNGTNMTINSNDGYMAMFQAAWSPEFYSQKDKDGNVVQGTGLEGYYQFGGYFYGGYDMPIFGTDDFRGNGYGFYLQGQQMVWRNQNNLSQYVTLWAGAQYAPVKSIAIMPWMVYAGVQLQGFIPHRSQDGIFVSWMTGWFSGNYERSVNTEATYETVIEVTYVYQLNSNISIQPDVQYIMRPYGNTNIDDALVIGGQLVVSF